MQQLSAKIQQVALHLPEWRYDFNHKHNYSVSMISSGGMRVNFQYRGSMINVYCSWPRLPDTTCVTPSYYGALGDGESAPNVNFRLTKSLSLIVNDLKKRVIEPYKPIFAKCLVKREEILERRELSRIKIDTLKRVGDISRHSNFKGSEDYPNLRFKAKDGWGGTLRLNSDGTVTFEYLSNISFDKAVQIVALLS